jgi:hypothetical protein
LKWSTDNHAPDATPRHIGSFEAIDESHHVIGSARGLPVEKLFLGHAAIESSRMHRVQMLRADSWSHHLLACI